MNKRQWTYVAIAAVVILLLAVSCVAQAARCDGNNGNGKGNVCEPASNPGTSTPAETDRQYTERVHTYAHGNSLGIQHLSRVTDALKADQVRQDTRATQADLGIEENRAAVSQHSKTLASHGSRLDSHDTQLAAYADVSSALNTRLGGAYERLESHESRISSLERNVDRLNESAAIGLAVAGHQFDTKGGFQTAVSASTVNGHQAIAVGMGGALSERVFLNAGVASSGSTTGGVVSSTFSW